MLEGKSVELLGSAEPVADAWLGDDVAWPAGVRLDLAPKLVDEDAQVVRLGLVLGTPDGM